MRVVVCLRAHGVIILVEWCHPGPKGLFGEDRHISPRCESLRLRCWSDVFFDCSSHWGVVGPEERSGDDTGCFGSVVRAELAQASWETPVQVKAPNPFGSEDHFLLPPNIPHVMVRVLSPQIVDPAHGSKIEGFSGMADIRHRVGVPILLRSASVLERHG